MNSYEMPFADAAPRGEAVVGQRVDGRYVLKREIARGGMGTVFEAQHDYTGRAVALKILHRHHARTPAVCARLLREARVLGAARHPSVVDVLDAGEDRHLGPFVVMEMLEGRTLEGILAVRHRLGVDESVQVALRLCEALAHAHTRGVVHRDVKPSNVFVARDERGDEVVKLFDFGIATPEDAPRAHDARRRQRLTEAGEVLGTPEYMAPEQLFGKDDVDARCDVYGVGATLYECLTGELPREGSYPEILLALATGRAIPSLRSKREDAGPALTAAVARAMEREPAARFATASAFALALAEAVRRPRGPTSLLGIAPPGVDAPVTAPPPAVVAPAQEPAAQRRRFARAPYVTPVRIVQASGALLDGRSEDVSVGGMLVLTLRACADAESVRVRFALPTTGAIVTLAATARWVRAARGGQGAVGLEFSDVPADVRAALAEYVKWLCPPSRD